MKEFDCPHCHRIFEGDPGDFDVVSCPHCNGTVETPERDLAPGTMVAGFEIIRLLGHGGMGNVYLANQVSMNRPVALKILLRSLTADKTSVMQFLNEAKVSGQMNHRNIITAIDAGEFEDRYFLVTSFVDGIDLEKRLEEDKKIPEKEALRIAISIAEALKYAWESHGILHKDIKPGNIIVDSTGEPFLLDMGIAQYIGDAPTDDEQIVGSPFYMSPEQTRAERLSWTTDLYSLGATLYNMIIGLPPYDADDVMKIIEMHSEAPFPMPKTRNPEAKISKASVMLLKKMMAKDPSERFDSWGGFKEAAERALKGGAPTGKTTSKKKKTGRKNKATIPKKKKRRHIPVQKKSGGGGGLLLVFIVFILLAVALGAAYIFFQKNKYDNAYAYIERAENYNRENPGEYISSLEYFRQAAAYSKGTTLEERANSGYLQILGESKKQAKLIIEYKEKRDSVDELIARKQYRKALEILEGLKTIIKKIKNKRERIDAESFIKIYSERLNKKLR